jgi:chromosome segregation ATPase
MFSILKPFVRLALIIVVIAGIAAAVAGPERMQAVAHQVQTEISQAIDSKIDDPVALRSQLRQLEKEYPERISQVRTDLSELQSQVRQLEREKAVAERVVELAKEDAASLTDVSNHDVSPVSTVARTVSVRYASSAANSRARARIAKAQQVAISYSERALDAERDLGYLYQQAERMEEVLAQLESERAQFQAQLMQLERQVDAVARNERLIKLMEKRNRTIEKMSRYEAGSLENLQGRLASIRNQQEAELEVLSNSHGQTNYEDRAKLELDSNDLAVEEMLLVLPEGVVVEMGSHF